MRIYNPFCVFVFQSTVEEVKRICEVLTSSHDMAHLLLLGHTHPQPLVQLAALHTGHTLTTPSQHFNSTLITATHPHGISSYSYKNDQLCKDLVHLYTVAGIKNEKIAILFTENQILHEDFLTHIHQFVRGGAISPLFSPEERSRIVTAIRSDLAQSGLTFTVETAWKFFLRSIS